MEHKYGTPPPNKREYLDKLGKQLVSDYGKKSFYQTYEVIDAIEKIEDKVITEIPWWGISFYCSFEDFEELHHKEFKGEEKENAKKEYKALRAELLIEFSADASSALLTLSESDFDMSWLDLGDEGIMEGIGEFIAAIFEGLSG